MANRKNRFFTRKKIITVVVAMPLGYAVYLLICAINAPADDPSRSRVSPWATSSVVTHAQLSADLRRLDALSRELRQQLVEMGNLQKTVGMKARGDFYTSDEHDLIESLLFRYLGCRASLWEMVDAAQEGQDRFTESDEQVKAFLIGFGAALHLTYYGSTLVGTFLDEPVVIAKLNEAYHPSDIPRGTYDRIFEGVTSIDNIEAVRTAWQLFRGEADNETSRVARILAADSDYRTLVDQFETLYQGTATQTQTILEQSSLLLPEVRNRLRHTEITALAKKALEIHQDHLYAARAVLFLKVSRLRSPVAKTVDFSADQIRRIKSALAPGDLVLTFKAGYMSNIFLPGVFKHGITYVGSPSQRQQAGLTPDQIGTASGGKREKLEADLAYARLPSGHEADVIEAVAEGVIFNSLNDLLSKEVNRLVVLRPRLTTEEMGESLMAIFRLLGSGYDFKFDFNDGTFQCCTEVIYRAFHARGEVDLALTPRMGSQTLSADDIVDYYLTAEHRPFEFVLLAEGEPGSSRARILTGAEGQTRLVELMGDDSR